ncbi:efflux RND transporter periplasmic adaptor subunit [Ancylobacter sp. SL191]|uniref:efflux RND transporter periplasmic adaptor subunit n=1 Tax=Ancylobacter sp. SL191 TaxID=2995166 RepID=UPI00227017F9|nr:efflux RND transporter periplasmic adaptor subunit [Ancylobacter sp. SL191]WAC29619.1 efflux RND transporter periplasmic adaptor subunit [Ancylobacter sp. SL191]
MPPTSLLLQGGRWFWARKWAIAGILVLGIAAGLGVLRWLVGPEVAVYPVLRSDLVKTVVASGHVETPFRVEIASQITATVAEVLVEEGQSVTAGQPLVALDQRELQAAVVQAHATSAQADAQLRQMRELTLPAAEESLKQAKATLLNAEAAFQRAEELATSGYGTRAVLDAATKDIDIAKTQVRTAELQVFTSTAGGADFVMAETQLEQAQASLNEAKARLGYATITSPRDGILITRSVERGTVVVPGQALLVLAPTGAVQLVLEIDEKNIGLLSLGQAALASADAYADQRFPAILSYINPSVDISRASIEVKLTTTKPPAYLRQDMTVSVDIEVARRDGVMVVPARTVHDSLTAAPWVLVVRNGRAQAQPVHIGLRAADSIEILSGVAPGEQLVPIASGIRAGQRLRPVAS